MENKNTSKRSKGRPKYIVDIPKLQELYKRIDNKEITNEERLEYCKMQKNKMVWIKEKIWETGGKIKCLVIWII